jgi:hypothetical protein
MIYIPTLGRVNKQITAKTLKEAGIEYRLVARPSEAEKLFSAGYKVIAEPDSLPKGIGHTRQFIMEWSTKSGTEQTIMMDDDLVFAVRGKREDNPLYLSPAEPSDVAAMVHWLRLTTEDATAYAMAGISSREGNNRKPGREGENTRIMRVFAINNQKFKDSGADFTSLKVMEDFDVTLTMLLAGYKNIENYMFTNNQNGSNIEGGCKEYRTFEVQGDAARALAAKYPQFVTTVQKETKTSWGGGVRTDVKIYWKRAYQAGATK